MWRRVSLLQANCSETLSNALSQALAKDLPNIRYAGTGYPENLQQEGHGLLVNIPNDWKTRRPHESEVRVDLFNQVVETQSLFASKRRPDKIGTYAVVVSHLKFSVIYFGKLPLAYMINRRISSREGLNRFDFDISKRDLASPSEAGRYD